MDVVDFKAAHLLQIDMQDEQQYLAKYMTEAEAVALERPDWTHSCVDDGVVLGCAGIIPLWPGRALAWSYISVHATGSKFVAVHRAVQNRLDNCYIKRIEMTVDCDFEAGHRWAELLGFAMEAPRMEAYRPDGGACALYARVR